MTSALTSAVGVVADHCGGRLRWSAHFAQCMARCWHSSQDDGCSNATVGLRPEDEETTKSNPKSSMSTLTAYMHRPNYNMHSCMYAYIHTHTHTHTHTQHTHIHTHIYTHTYTHTQPEIRLCDTV